MNSSMSSSVVCCLSPPHAIQEITVGFVLFKSVVALENDSSIDCIPPPQCIRWWQIVENVRIGPHDGLDLVEVSEKNIDTPPNGFDISSLRFCSFLFNSVMSLTFKKETLLTTNFRTGFRLFVEWDSHGLAEEETKFMCSGYNKTLATACATTKQHHQLGLSTHSPQFSQCLSALKVVRASPSFLVKLCLIRRSLSSSFFSSLLALPRAIYFRYTFLPKAVSPIK